MALQIEVAGKGERGIVMGITGRPGAGKTSLLGTFPKPLILDLEDGTAVLDGRGVEVHRTWEAQPGGYFDEFQEVLRDVARLKPNPYRTLCIDSWTRLSERLGQDVVANDPEKPRTLNQALGGYGAGARRVKDMLLEAIKNLQWLSDHRKMHIVWTMHETVTSTDLPTGEVFTEFATQGEKKASEQLEMACDVIAALDQKRRVVEGKGGKPGKVKGTGERELFTGSSPYRRTKSRFHEGPTKIAVVRGENPFADFMS